MIEYYIACWFVSQHESYEMLFIFNYQWDYIPYNILSTGGIFNLTIEYSVV